MSDTTPEPNEPEVQQPAEPGVDEPLGENGLKALQAERDRARDLERQLKAANDQLAQIERSNETAIEKAQREANEAQEAAAKATAEALRLRVAAKHGISDEDADLFLTGSDEQTLTRQAERLAARADERKRNSNHVPKEGTSTTGPGPSELSQFTQQLFKGAQA